MKYNLKNRPKIYKIPSNVTEHLEFETQIIEWFEAFEKELREYHTFFSESDKWSKKDLIKEVLGE